MGRFNQISEAIARRIDHSMLAMSRLDSVEALEIQFMEDSPRILPGDCLCWNNWSLDLTHPLSVRTTPDYIARISELHDAFADTLSFHPVIVWDSFAETAKEVKGLSDYESSRQFRENPLFREVYRHLDSHFQIAYIAGVLRDRCILLTWNRRAIDFTDRERQILHYMGLRLGAVSRHIEQREALGKNWRSLCAFVDSRMGTASATELGEGDLKLVTSLMEGRSRNALARDNGVRRDSIDKRLGRIYERLGLENHQQLLSALADMRVGE